MRDRLKGILAMLLFIAVFSWCVFGCWSPPRIKVPDQPRISATTMEKLKDTLSPEEFAEFNEYDLIAAELKGVKKGVTTQKLIDRESGRKMIRRFSMLVAVICGVGFFISLLLIVLGLVARRTAVTGAVVSLSGIFVSYFLIVYGALVGEIVAWSILGGLVLLVLPFGLWQLYLFMRQLTAQKIAAKRDEQGTSANDAIFALPVTRKVKSQLADAWNLLQERIGPIQTQAQHEAHELLLKYKLPVPNPTGGK